MYRYVRSVSFCLTATYTEQKLKQATVTGFS